MVLGEVVVEVVAELAVHDALLLQRHPEAQGHAADELGARGLRVDDAADREHAEHAREPDLAAVGVDADLDELGAEGVARELGLRLDLVAGVDGHLALALRRAAPRRPARRRCPTRRCPSSRRRRGVAEVGVADLEPHVLGVDAERVGGDLGQDGARAGADVGGGDLDREAPSASKRAVALDGER